MLRGQGSMLGLGLDMQVARMGSIYSVTCSATTMCDLHVLGRNGHGRGEQSWGAGLLVKVP
jgi:hypothetical protein